MFIDYYSTLNVDHKANSGVIKRAYRRQAIKWHPDKNPGKDTASEMQQVNEAYLILGDPDARERYDKEYTLFKQKFSGNEETDSSYDIQDDILNDWINKARRQSIDLAKQTIQDIVGLTKESTSAAFDRVKYLVLLYILIQIAWFLFT
ncbi:MAG: DnaJ domain-containing protein [Nitrospina sp.]|nr:DnaJ domain-containing protein [Nitrospina sp.]